MDMNSDEGQTVYMFHTNNAENKNIFSKLANMRDNGVVTIGAILAILNPKKLLIYTVMMFHYC